MIDERYRTYLEEMRALTTDAEGREVLVGLSFEETAELHRYIERRDAPNFPFEPGDDELTARYEVLDSKHELARQQVLAAERENCIMKPPMN
jgi:hypothetical protein